MTVTAYDLTSRIVKTMMAYDPDHRISGPDKIACVVSIVVDMINSAPTPEMRAALALATLQTVVDETDADMVGALIQSTALAMATPAGTA